MTKNTLLLTFLIFVFLLTACGNNNEPLEQIDENNSNDVQTIDQQDEKEDYMNRVINVGTIHAPPYEMVENTEYSGPGIEIVIAVLESLEYEYTIQDYPWIRNLEMMEAGDLDMLVDAYIRPSAKHLHITRKSLMVYFRKHFLLAQIQQSPLMATYHLLKITP